MDILHTCDAVISGSTALHTLLPKLDTPWTPADLDIYVPQSTSTQLLNRIMAEGYSIVTDEQQLQMRYTHSHMHRVVVLSNGERNIDIVVSVTSVALSPIFHFHSTAVMNFVSADTIYCSYPRLTFRHLSLVNASVLYYGGHMDDIVDTMRKYMGRGFEYV
ncbi:hypothetical protein BKA83DRAFT_4070863 [Pisolithus microcarpus]|nr:hypothetical protein BKA83DRAFT_4070863 [Pisolithus microcarpus]